MTARFREAGRQLLGPKNPHTIPWLDFCRTCAIVLILGSHVFDFGITNHTARAMLSWGWTGVDLFFVLSGYLIAKQLWSELQKTRTICLGRFLFKRGLRIWPLYYTTIIVVFLLDSVRGRSAKPLLTDIFSLSDYYHHQVPGGWSLSIEEQFYLLLPLLLFVFRRFPPERLLAVPLLWLAALPLSRYWTQQAFPNATDLLAYGFHTHTDGLAIGVILAWLAVYRKAWWHSGRGAILLPAAAIAVGLIEHKFHSYPFSFTCIAIFYGGVVLAGLRARLPNQITNWRPLHVMSRLSYSSYLNNLILVETLAPHTGNIMARHGGSFAFFLAWYAGFVLLSNTVAFVTYALIELPFLRMRERSLPSNTLALEAVANT